MPSPLDPLLQRQLSDRAEAQQLRRRRIVRPLDAVHVEVDGRRLINFCSNNYLGLTHHPRVIEAMRSAALQYGSGAGAAGLISGYSAAHASVESAIARWKGTEAAVLLPSGYQANAAAIQTLAAVGAAGGGGARFIVDKLAHASLLDAVAATGAPWRCIPHNGISKLTRLLQEAEAGQLQVLVTESIFSMDGDAVDLAAIAPIKQKYGLIVLLDEAHASGVYGPGGAGYAAEMGLAHAVDVSVVTLSKAAGCVGGAVCGSRDFCDAVVNFGRAYLYSTSPAPPVAAAIEAAIGVMRDEPQLQERVRDLARRLRRRLSQGGIALPPGDGPIIPIVVGDESAALRRAEALMGAGLLVQAVRPPTVPRGTSRLRVTLCCGHSDAEVDQLTEALLSGSA
ncbi:MAG: 8-amino-7-oxononanoate synthase [Tepidisphaeraceae bacterium]|jgi:8-amino-7-oxononanoate synthase